MSTNREGLERILHKVRHLLDMAERETSTEAERSLARQRAEEMMRKYRIEEEQMIAEDAPNATAPIFRAFVFCSADTPFLDDYLGLVTYAALHCDIRFAWGFGSVDGVHGAVIHAVGYEADVSYTEMLATSARLVMRRHLEPEIDRSLSDEGNIYRLRSAGLERVKISEMMWNSGSHVNNARVTKLYKDACRKRGEEPKVVGRDVSAKDYRIAYARSFVRRFAERLRETRDATDRVGGVLQLHGRTERVSEAFYERFPHLRPATEVDATSKGKPKKWTAADERRYARMYLGKSARLGEDVGRSAADEIELRETSPKKRPLDEGMEAWTQKAWKELAEG